MANNWPANSSAYGNDAEQRFGRTVRAMREGRGWSQALLAQRLTEVSQGLKRRGGRGDSPTYTQSMIAKTEAAERPITLNEAVNLAFIFGESLELMLAMEQEPGLVEEIHQLEEHLSELDGEIEALEERRQRVGGDLLYAKSQAQLAAIMRDQGRVPGAGRREWDFPEQVTDVPDPDEED